MLFVSHVREKPVSVIDLPECLSSDAPAHSGSRIGLSLHLCYEHDLCCHCRMHGPRPGGLASPCALSLLDAGKIRKDFRKRVHIVAYGKP